MRRLLLAASLAALASACTKPCEELGNRICKCSPTGSSTQSCEREVSSVISSVGPSSTQEARCSELLDTCHSPAGVEFCTWLASADGKVACGLAY